MRHTLQNTCPHDVTCHYKKNQEIHFLKSCNRKPICTKTDQLWTLLETLVDNYTEPYTKLKISLLTKSETDQTNMKMCNNASVFHTT